MEWLQILLQWDQAQAPILSASLAALSLTAASFLYAIESRLKTRQASVNSILGSIGKPDAEQICQEHAQECEAEAAQVKTAIKNLINAFYWFIATLIHSLSLDSLIDQDLAQRGLPVIGEIANEAGALMPWLAADVGIFTTLFTCGLWCLLTSGKVVKTIAVKS